MCVIIHQPKGSHLDKETAKTCWNKNPEGGGFAYMDDNGKIQVEKYMEFGPYWKAFENARSLNPRRDFLLHMRIATHGEVNTANVHPFFQDERELTVVAHNGIIASVPDYNDGRSDTRVFIDEVLPQLPPNWLDTKYLKEMVEEWVGWSRLVFLTVDPMFKENIYILNKNSGSEHQGMWFSNTSYIKPTPYVHQMATIVHKSGVSYIGDDKWWNDRINNRAPQISYSAEQIAIDMKEEMIEVRTASGLVHDLFANDDAQGFQCFGCDEEIDMLTGECACFDKICLDCSDWAAYCSCKDGFSYHLVLAKNAPKEVYAKVTRFDETEV